jgi:Aldolase/RraA
MATQRSIRLTAKPRPPCPGQPVADFGLVHTTRRDLTGAVREIGSCIDHHLDDTRRYVEGAGISARTIHEVVGLLGLIAPCVRPIYPTAKLCGTAVTGVLAPGDNWMLRVATEQLESGDVVGAAACRPECEDGLVGELVATSVRASGGVGQVIDGGRRDAAALEAMTLPVFSRAINSKGHDQGRSGLANGPGWPSSAACAGDIAEEAR